MLKKQARKLYSAKREELSASERMKWDDLILINFQTIDLPFLEYVLSFYPMEEKNEVNTFLLTDYLHFKKSGFTDLLSQNKFCRSFHAGHCLRR